MGLGAHTFTVKLLQGAWCSGVLQLSKLGRLQIVRRFFHRHLRKTRAVALHPHCTFSARHVNPNA